MMRECLVSVIFSLVATVTFAAFGDEIRVDNPTYTPGVGTTQTRWSIRNWDLGDGYFVAMTLNAKYVVKLDLDNDSYSIVAPAFDAGQNNMFRCDNLLMSAHSVNFKTFKWDKNTETMTGPIQTFTQANMLSESGIATRSQDTYAGGWTSDCTKYFYPISSDGTDTGFGWFDVNPTTGTFTWGGKHMCSAAVCAGVTGVTEYQTALTGSFDVSGDGLHVFMGKQTYGVDATGGGAVLYYKYSGGSWGEAWLTPPSTVANHKVGMQLQAWGDRMFVAVGYTGFDAYSNIYVYGNDNGNFVYEDAIPYTFARMIFGMNNPNSEMRICTTAHYPVNVPNSGTLNVFDLVDGVWTNTFSQNGPYQGSKWGYEGGLCGSNYAMTFDSYYTMETYGSTGFISAYGTPTAPQPPPQCTVSADCAAGTYCRGFACFTAKDCTTHAECLGEFDSGRLPYCNKVQGKCADIKASTCASDALCITAAKKHESVGKSVGSIAQTLSVADGTKRTAAAQSMITKLKNTTSSVESDLVVFVESTEVILMDSALFTENDQATVLSSIADVRCGDAADECVVTLLEGVNRRRLGEARDLAGSYTVTITFDVTDEAFAQIDNSTSFDDPAFAAALAAAAGVNASDVEVLSTSGDLVITFTLTDESVDGEPTDPNVFTEISSIQSSLTSVTSEVVSELALDGGDIVTASVDLCNTRDCGGFGAELCDSNTGVCACPDGWWGVNCDIETDCENGGIPLGSYCTCQYPNYGLRCEETSYCGNQTCSA